MTIPLRVLQHASVFRSTDSEVVSSLLSLKIFYERNSKKTTCPIQWTNNRYNVDWSTLQCSYNNIYIRHVVDQSLKDFSLFKFENQEKPLRPTTSTRRIYPNLKCASCLDNEENKDGEENSRNVAEDGGWSCVEQLVARTWTTHATI